MKADRLEKFVSENRQAFDVHEPEPQLWKQIQKKRQLMPGKKWRTIMTRAATVLLIFTAAFLLSEYLHFKNRTPFAREDHVKIPRIPELQEAEAYYTSQLNDRMKQIDNLLVKNPEMKQEIRADLDELDQIYSGLKSDLKDNIDNDQVIEAMIQHYRIKLQILEDILEEIQESKKAADDEERKYDI